MLKLKRKCKRDRNTQAEEEEEVVQQISKFQPRRVTQSSPQTSPDETR